MDGLIVRRTRSARFLVKSDDVHGRGADRLHRAHAAAIEAAGPRRRGASGLIRAGGGVPRGAGAAGVGEAGLERTQAAASKAQPGVGAAGCRDGDATLPSAYSDDREQSERSDASATQDSLLR